MDHAPDGYVERVIREASADGAFDHLSGAGKPIPDLAETDDPAWWAKRWVKRQRSVEAALDVAAEVERELGKVWLIPESSEVRSRVAELNHRLEEANRDLDERSRLELLDPDQVLGSWKLMRGLRARATRRRR